MLSSIASAPASWNSFAKRAQPPGEQPLRLPITGIDTRLFRLFNQPQVIPRADVVVFHFRKVRERLGRSDRPGIRTPR